MWFVCFCLFAPLPPSLFPSLLLFPRSPLLMPFFPCEGFVPSFPLSACLHVFVLLLAARNSGRTCMFVRELKPAIYGSVWHALEVRIGARMPTFISIAQLRGCHVSNADIQYRSFFVSNRSSRRDPLSSPLFRGWHLPSLLNTFFIGDPC